MKKIMFLLAFVLAFASVQAQFISEDFDSLNFTVHNLENNTCSPFLPYSYQGQDNPFACTNETGSADDAHWITASPFTDDGSTYSLLAETDVGRNIGVWYPYRVDGVDIGLTSLHAVTFDAYTNFDYDEADSFELWLTLTYNDSTQTLKLIDGNGDYDEHDPPYNCMLVNITGDIIENPAETWNNIEITADDFDDAGCTFTGKTLTNISIEADVSSASSNFTANHTFFIDNLFIGVPNVTYLYRERFNDTSSTWGLNEADCSVDSFNSASLEGTSGLVMDNPWYCYVENDTSASLSYTSYSGSEINTARGMVSSLTGGSVPNYDSFASIVSSDIDMTRDDYIDFYCDMSGIGTDNYGYLVFSPYFLNSSGFPVALSMKDGGCAFNNSIPFLDSCCEVSTVSGADCTSGKTHYTFTMGNVSDTCNEVGELNFQNIQRLEVWRSKLGSNAGTYYFDDLSLFRLNYGNNTLPTILFNTPLDDPAEVNDTVRWSVSISDVDDPSSAIWSAFDCNTNGSLDYGLAKRGIGIVFNCTYPTQGNFTGTAYATDDSHLGVVNASLANSVEIFTALPLTQSPTGGDCVGFIDPNTCSGNCTFSDNFNYANHPISCAGWLGTGNVINPTDLSAHVFGLPLSIFGFYHDDTILESQTTSFEVEFDFTLNDDHTMQFDILNDDLNQYVVYVLFQNFVITAYDQTYPFTNVIGSVSSGAEHNFRVFVDFQADTAYYYLDDVLVSSSEFYDGPADSAKKFTFSWSSGLMDFDIDNYQVNLLSSNPNATVTAPEVDYVFDSELFCAVNWSSPVSSLDKFTQQNCEDRGYSDNFLFLCIPRACASDTISLVFMWATDNILVTIVVAMAFIIGIPFFVMLIGKIKN